MEPGSEWDALLTPEERAIRAEAERAYLLAVLAERSAETASMSRREFEKLCDKPPASAGTGLRPGDPLDNATPWKLHRRPADAYIRGIW